MTAPARGRGGIFSRNNGTSWDVIGEVVKITPGGISKSAIKTTTLNPTDGFDTFMSGLKTAKPVTVVMNLDPAVVADVENQGLLYGDVAGDVDEEYAIEFVDDGPNLTFTAVAIDFDIGELNDEGLIPATFQCQPSGKPVWADSWSE